MSLVINVVTPEGIVLAADSRQSYTNRKGISRVGSDNAKKLFQINSRVALALTGLAFIEKDGILKNVGLVVEEFTRIKNIEEKTVEEIAKGIYKLFSENYNVENELKKIEKNVMKDLQMKSCKNIEIVRRIDTVEFSFIDPRGHKQKVIAKLEKINFVVAGYNKDGSYEVYLCYLPGDIQKKRESNVAGKEYGALWLGQTDLVARIILGFDPRIRNVKSIGDLSDKIGDENLQNELRNLEYSIQWGTMTLQDGIDFSDLMIKTTAAIQKFSDGILAEPGDMPGVGGDVDIAVLTKNKGFVWVNKKGIVYNGNKIEF